MKHPIEALAEMTGGADMLENCSIVPESGLKQNCGFDFRPLTPKERRKFKESLERLRCAVSAAGHKD
jgi:hypothetical protein